MPASTRRVRMGIGVLSLLLLLHLLTGDSPWSTGAWSRLELGQVVAPLDAMAFVWLASLGNLVLLGVLFGLAPRWVGPAEAPEREELEPPAPAKVLIKRVLVAAAMVLLLLQAWPRMGHSLWVDEEYSALRSILGGYEIEADGRPDWEKIKWRDTFWAYRQPNNHVPFSILSRISTTIADTRRPEEGVEVALRMPALVAGLLGLPAIAALGGRLGFAWAGVLAAWGLALHPWYLRFASAGRGYSLMLFLLPLYWVASWRVLQRASWGRFAALGALQLLLMWSYPALFLLVGITNLWMLFESWRTRAPNRPMAPFLQRLGVTAMAGAMAFFQLMTPNLVQLQAYMARKEMRFSDHWFRDLGSLLLTGSLWGRNEGDPVSPTGSALLEASPALVYAAGIMFALAVAAGILRLARRGGTLAGFSAVLALSVPLTLAWAWTTDSFIYHHYLVFGLVSLVLLAAIGVSSRPRGERAGLALPAASVGALGVLLILIGQPSRHALIALPIGPVRDSVLATRPTLDPADARNDAIVTVGLGGCPHFYDPRCRSVSTVDQLHALLREADASEKALFVNYANLRQLKRRIPEVLAIVESGDLFEPVGEYPAFRSTRWRFVRRYRPGRALPAPDPKAPS